MHLLPAFKARKAGAAGRQGRCCRPARPVLPAGKAGVDSGLSADRRRLCGWLAGRIAA
jgi:hypothetical protein